MPHLHSPAQPPSHPHAVYSGSPLRNVQLQSEIGIAGRRALRLKTSHDSNRHNFSYIFQNILYDALDSSEPVDLLPHISKRAALLNRARSYTVPDENLGLSAIEETIPEANPANSAQPPVREELLKAYRSPHNGAWVLDEVLYATPPGRTPPGTV